MRTMRILIGDARKRLRELPDASVHCVVTSPPYWGLRDYGVEGQLGLEPTPEEYVANLVAVFREVRRVLRDDGTVWLNLGDSYASAWACKRRNVVGNGSPDENTERGRIAAGLKEKDLVGIPWRVAFALQADGWWLRQDIIWSKPNPMPESVRDRCTKAHEYLFLLSKRDRYYFDAEAIAEPANPETQRSYPVNATEAIGNTGGNKRTDFEKKRYIVETRNKRSVWTITTHPFPEAHFATFPPAIVEPCIKAGTSEKGCCYECGAPWVRVIAEAPRWEPSCRCKIPGLIDAAAWTPKPCTVLDPFAGSGTAGLVADRLGRNAVLIELNPEYAAMAERRISEDAGMFASAFIAPPETTEAA